MRKKKPRFWKSLPPEDKKGIVKTLLEGEHTCAAIGKALGTTKNAVVGYQHTKLPDLTGRTIGTKDEVPQEVLMKLLGEEWPPETSPEDGTLPGAERLVSRKLTANWNNKCTYSGGCDYERLPGSTTCGRPRHNT